MKTDQPKTIRLSDYRPPEYLIDSLALEFDLAEQATRVTATSRVRRNPDAAATPEPSALRLDGEDLKLVSISIDGRVLSDKDFERDEESLTLPAPPASFTLEVVTEIDPSANTRLEGLYLSGGNFCTQCEAEGFRRITYFLDRPDVMARYRTTLRAAKEAYPVLLSNGNLVEQGALEPGPEGQSRHFAVWDDPHPKPSYLFALVAGDLAKVEDCFATASGRQVTLAIYVEHGNEDRCDYAMDSLKRAMRWDEERYGLEYDLDLFNIVAVSDFNMGAMENKSLNIFNAKYVLANPETATDSDYAFIESIVAHEYFHNWTGNRVTCRDWFQLSLKEGLTVFRDQEFSADMRSRAVTRISDVRSLRARQFPEDAGPLAHPVRPDSYIEINNFYTATVYEKGAEVIRMMQSLLGREGFRRGIDLYFERHDGQAVTCDDFAAAMADANGVDLTQFKLWYSQAGTPKLHVAGRYDAAAQSYELTVRQELAPTPGQPDKRPMVVPLGIGLLDSSGAELTLNLADENRADSSAAQVLQVTEPQQVFRFVDVPSEPVPSLNRDFSAPVKCQFDYSDQDRALLMAHDSDSFNRWEAAQQFAAVLLLARIEQIQRDRAAASAEHYISALHSTLKSLDLDKALAAQVLALPSEDFLADQMETVDVEAIHTAREGLRREIAQTLQSLLLDTYRRQQSNEPFQPTAEQAGRRALKNVALGYLAALPQAGMRDLVENQYEAADNMTDRMAALALLNDVDSPARTAALDDFHARFEADTNVIDKWLSVQAMSRLPGTLERVRGLLDHPAFSIKVPNKVRALIGAFAGGNPLHFHAGDGSGYRFLADQILQLDPLNPQVAARLTAPLGRWRRFDTARQELMKGELERVLAKPNLSNDVYEIAAKSLGREK